MYEFGKDLGFNPCFSRRICNIDKTNGYPNPSMVSILVFLDEFATKSPKYSSLNRVTSFNPCFSRRICNEVLVYTDGTTQTEFQSLFF